MSGFSVMNYALANKKIKSALSGVKGYRVDESTRTLYIDLNDGTTLKMQFPQVNSIVDLYKDDDNYLVAKLTDGTLIQICKVPEGNSLEFNWNGTSLGVRVEGETEYKYVNLASEYAPDNISTDGDEIYLTYMGSKVGTGISFSKDIDNIVTDDDGLVTDD